VKFVVTRNEERNHHETLVFYVPLNLKNVLCGMTSFSVRPSKKRRIYRLCDSVVVEPIDDVLSGYQPGQMVER
jgi:hypothetical protein